jgi:hypothetical protein
MVVGGFGPWAKVFGLLAVSGTDGGDGWIVIVAAVIGAVSLFLWRRRSRRWLILAVVAGGAAFAAALYDRIDLARATVGGIDVSPLVSPGWGIYAAMVGSASLAAAGVVGWLVTAKSPVATPTA